MCRFELKIIEIQSNKTLYILFVATTECYDDIIKMSIVWIVHNINMNFLFRMHIAV